MRSSDWFVQVLSRTVAASGSCLLNVRDKRCVHFGNNVHWGVFGCNDVCFRLRLVAPQLTVPELPSIPGNPADLLRHAPLTL
jgi:hypothetical protein